MSSQRERDRDRDSRAQSEDGEVREDTPSPKRFTTTEKIAALTETAPQVPLPYEDNVPLPEEAAPSHGGWERHWDPTYSRWYLLDRETNRTQWEDDYWYSATTHHGPYVRYTPSPALVSDPAANASSPQPKRLVAGGYNPAIHGSYDKNADYAKLAEQEEEEEEKRKAAIAAAAAAATYGYGHGLLNTPAAPEYTNTAHFNRRTGQFQHQDNNPEYHNDENKSRRQMDNFFDVDAAANSHQGRSLKEERKNNPLTGKRLQAMKKKQKEKKEQKRRKFFMSG